jgi:hypothetical protein
MDEECGAAIDAGLEEANTLFGGSPGFDYEVVELFAKELVDYGFVGTIDFKKIGKRADGGEVDAERAGFGRRRTVSVE